jgi:penicillin amidase
VNTPLKDEESSVVGVLLRALLLLLWLLLLSHKLGSIPPLGKFFSPFEGFWRNAEIHTPRSSEIKVAAVSGIADLPDAPFPVKVEYDHRGVPHIFAPDWSGLFFAQGYVTARDRL